MFAHHPPIIVYPTCTFPNRAGPKKYALACVPGPRPLIKCRLAIFHPACIPYLPSFFRAHPPVTEKVTHHMHGRMWSCETWVLGAIELACIPWWMAVWSMSILYTGVWRLRAHVICVQPTCLSVVVPSRPTFGSIFWSSERRKTVKPMCPMDRFHTIQRV